VFAESVAALGSGPRLVPAGLRAGCEVCPLQIGHVQRLALRLGPEAKVPPCRTAARKFLGHDKSVGLRKPASDHAACKQETICLWPASRSVDTAPRTMGGVPGEKALGNVGLSTSESVHQFRRER